MSNFNLAVRNGRQGFRTDIVYDVNVAVLIHYSDKYKNRVAAFQRFGLLNLGGLRIHVTVMGSPGDGDFADEICNGWSDGVDVTLIEMSSNLPVPKINGYYLWLKNCGLRSRWEIRVDDDSITDLGMTVASMDAKYGDGAVHLLTWPMEEEGSGAPFTQFIRANGIEMPTFVHEYESSLTSGEGLRRIFANADSMDFLERTGKVIAAPGDRSLTFAAHIAGVPVGNNHLFSKDFLPHELSILPNRSIAHIHYVPWGDVDFVRELEAYLHTEFRNVVPEDVRELQNSPAKFGTCLKEVKAILRFMEDGSISGSNHADQRLWKLQGSELYLMHEQGYVTSIFRRVVRASGVLWFFGPNLWNGNMDYLQVCAEE